MCASEDSISLERTADTKEEVAFCNSEDLSDNCTPENHNSLGVSVSSEEEIILWNQWSSVTPRQSPGLDLSFLILFTQIIGAFQYGLTCN